MSSPERTEQRSASSSSFNPFWDEINTQENTGRKSPQPQHLKQQPPLTTPSASTSKIEHLQKQRTIESPVPETISSQITGDAIVEEMKLSSLTHETYSCGQHVTILPFDVDRDIRTSLPPVEQDQVNQKALVTLLDQWHADQDEFQSKVVLCELWLSQAEGIIHHTDHLQSF